MDIQDVDAVAALLADRFPQPESDPECEIETRMIPQGQDFNHELGEIRCGTFVLWITDGCFDHKATDIENGLHHPIEGTLLGATRFALHVPTPKAK